MLFAQRKRQRALADREAAGESLWTKNFGERTRVRIWQTFASSFEIGGTETWRSDNWERICDAVRRHVLTDEGLERLSPQPALRPSLDIHDFLINRALRNQPG